MAEVVLAPIHARLLNTWTVLAASAVAASHTGSTAETALATIAIAAGAMGPNGALRVTSLWSNNSNGNNKTFRHKFGGTSFHGWVATTLIGSQMQFTLYNRNSQSSQIGHTANGGSFAASATALVTGAINTASAQNLQLLGQLANAGDTVTLEAYLVELLYGA
jgi:hypothetical protein